ncbi:hypothetical protein DAEQUDRAFT_532711 [Daedalea quercina L-15889]|uniref:Uncharacterized protein n=1 Tax=Daedalea quercina L-15889 TaxID=1314783 RepID=A0A165M6S6_9APHY|nr:hypothetical protein DAEQUDRAFT_532711 [Daedalea quercina L-15889]
MNHGLRCTHAASVKEWHRPYCMFGKSRMGPMFRSLIADAESMRTQPHNVACTYTATPSLVPFHSGRPNTRRASCLSITPLTYQLCFFIPLAIVPSI